MLGDQQDVVSPFMDLAFKQAEKALERGDLPVGAIITVEGEILAAASNRNTSEKTWLSHAEQNALLVAGPRLRYEYEVNGKAGTLYSSLEPCLMCIGQALFCRISKIYYGGRDPNYSGMSVLHLDANEHYRRLSPSLVGPIHQYRCDELFLRYKPTWPFSK